ncbi:MAG: hypothetical protein ABIN17_02670 [candidate division WOR-3 bacterium]
MRKFLFIFPSILFSLSLSPGDFPFAKILSRGEFKFDIRFQKKGGLLFSLDASILDKFSFGLRYGGLGIVGDQKVEFYPFPGINVSYLLIEESIYLPSVLLGIETQGFDEYFELTERYFVKSKGIFLAISKDLNILRGFILNGGINRTFETKDEKNGMDVFSSLILNFSPEFSIFSEYSFGFNDPIHKKGIFNAGVLFNLQDQFFFSFSFRDLLSDNHIRTFSVGYKGYL